MSTRRIHRHVKVAAAVFTIPLSCSSDEDPPTGPGPAGPPARLRFLTSPASVEANTTIAPAVRVVVEDANGNPVDGDSITIDIGERPWPAMLIGTTVAPGISTGVSFSDVRIDRPGPGYTLTATSGSLTATTEPFDVHASFTDVATGGPNANYDGHSCAIASGGTFCWGANGDGQVGVAGTSGMELAPSLVPNSRSFVEVRTGGRHACGRTAAGAILCWGRGSEGQLGHGFTNSSVAPVAVVGSGSGALVFTSISVGLEHACAVATDGAVYCWGANRYGEVGDGTQFQRSAPVRVSGSGSGGRQFVSVSAGTSFTCGVTSTRAVWCWGEGSSGQLGSGASGSNVPIQVTGTGSGSLLFNRVSAGFGHACALTAAPDAGRIYCWGINLFGALGNGSSVSESNVPVLVISADRFTNVSAATSFTCALSTAGAVWCWGRNLSGELGVGSRDHVSLPVPVVVPNGMTFTHMESGGMHTCAVANAPATARGVYCWGANDDGRLGDGSTTARLVPTRIIQ